MAYGYVKKGQPPPIRVGAAQGKLVQKILSKSGAGGAGWGIGEGARIGGAGKFGARGPGTGSMLRLPTLRPGGGQGQVRPVPFGGKGRRPRF